jgi:hypothetical protein
VGLGGGADDRQAEAEVGGGAAACVGSGEFVEYPAELFVGDAGSGIGDGDGCGAVVACDRDLDLVAVAGESDGVVDDRVQRQGEPVFVGEHGGVVDAAG